MTEGHDCAPMMRRALVVAAAALLAACVPSQPKPRPDSRFESTDSLEAATRLLVKAAGPDILDCFQERQHFGGLSVTSVDLSGPLLVVEGTITMSGLLGHHTLDVHVELNPRRRTIRVTPGATTSPAEPDPRCGLREGRSLTTLSPAAREAAIAWERALSG